MRAFKNTPKKYAIKFSNLSKFKKKLNTPKRTRRGGFKF